MPQLDDYEIQKEPLAPGEDEQDGGTGLWTVLVAAIAVLAAAGAYYWYQRDPAPAQPVKANVQARPPAGPARGPGEPGEDIDLPPLDQSDEVVRELVRRLSSHPTVAAWLTTDGLVRNFTVVTMNIADGGRPERHLRPLAPTSDFLTRGNEANLTIDPRSYARYDRVADAVQAIDARGAARLYATLKPRIEEAYRELGDPRRTFDDVLEQAIVQLLRVPIVTDPIRVTPKPMSYAYSDPALEGLTLPQKHLLRMGPNNVRLIQGKLREIAGYLGIPPGRLPAPPPLR